MFLQIGKLGSTRMSLLSRTTMSLCAARNPAFDPPPKARFSLSGRTRTSGNVSSDRKIGFDAHVAVEQDDDVVMRGAESRVRSSAEGEIFFERQNADIGKCFFRSENWVRRACRC